MGVVAKLSHSVLIPPTVDCGIAWFYKPIDVIEAPKFDDLDGFMTSIKTVYLRKPSILNKFLLGGLQAYHLLHPRLASSLFRFLLYFWFFFLSSPYVIHWPSFQAWVYCGTFLTTSCSTLSYRQQGEEMGQTLHTFTALAHNHKYTQEVTDKGGMATRDRERERCVCVTVQGRARGKRRGSELLPICLANVVQTSPHLTSALFTATRRAQSWRIVLHLVPFFFPAATACSLRCAHIHANLCTDAFRQRTKSKCRHKHRHPTEQTDTCTVTHADTHKGVTLISHCVCLLALFHPSHHDSQSLRITATSASTEKSMLKYINKNTIKPIEWKATSGPLKWCFPPAEGADEPRWRERGGWCNVSFVSSSSFSSFLEMQAWL